MTGIGSEFVLAFAHFRKAFRERTSVKWEDRLNKDIVAQAIWKAKEAGAIKVRTAEAEGKIVTEEMRKEWENANKLFNWNGAARSAPKVISTKKNGG